MMKQSVKTPKGLNKFAANCINMHDDFVPRIEKTPALQPLVTIAAMVDGNLIQPGGKFCVVL